MKSPSYHKHHFIYIKDFLSFLGLYMFGRLIKSISAIKVWIYAWLSIYLLKYLLNIKNKIPLYLNNISVIGKEIILINVTIFKDQQSLNWRVF